VSAGHLPDERKSALRRMLFNVGRRRAKRPVRAMRDDAKATGTPTVLNGHSGPNFMFGVYPAVRNTVLGSLHPDDLQALTAYIHRTKFEARSILHRQKNRLENVGFVETGLVSLRIASNIDVAELALVGVHGVVGASALLGADGAFHHYVALTSGVLLNVPAEKLFSLMETRPQIREHLLRHIQAFLVHCSQVVLCSQHHHLEQRLSSWLCHAFDEAGEADIPVTHDYLSTMMGLRRPSVTKALKRFESDGIITKIRGNIRVQDRARLGTTACSCYSTMSKIGRNGTQLKVGIIRSASFTR
jgi:CRP-like cAMP-binding protein